MDFFLVSVRMLFVDVLLMASSFLFWYWREWEGFWEEVFHVNMLVRQISSLRRFSWSFGTCMS